jgi:hypothetical protein
VTYLDWLFVLTHILAFAVGYFMCHWLTIRAGEALTDREDRDG